MPIDLSDITNMTFRTTRIADTICEELIKNLGWRHRYVAARLAIARSVSLPSAPKIPTADERSDMARPLRGSQLFGEEKDQAAWLALITQRAVELDMSKQSFQALVTAHWTRGAALLGEDWKQADNDMGRFIENLGSLANLSSDSEDDTDMADALTIQAVTAEVRLSVGEIAQDARTGEVVEFALNGAGGSPHIAIMGGVGSGKTRTAIHMLNTLREVGDMPLLAFDFKGDLAEGLKDSYAAEVLSPPGESIPLDVLHVESGEDTVLKMAAACIRDSIASVKSSKIGGVQSDALREAVMIVLSGRTTAGLSRVARALEDEYEERGRKQDELTATLNELTQFDLFSQKLSPHDFFSKSWIVRLPQDSSEELRKLIINLTLNSLDRWLNALPDAPMDAQGIRAIRHITLLDEAHVILKTKLRALENLARMSRSKGGVLMLASQSPDDFEGVGDGYLDNMGLTLAFNTQAKPGPTKRIFGANSSLTGLSVGEALCRIRAEARTRKIVAWAN